MKILAIALFVLVFGANDVQAETIGDKIRDEIRTRDVHLELDLFSLDLGDYAGIDVQSGIRVFPNQDGSTYSRSEPLSFQFQLGHNLPMDLITVGGSKTLGLNGEFIRQFDSQVNAFNVIKYPPYIFDNSRIVTGNRIPLTADRAIQLGDKDYFRYQVRSALTFNFSAGKELGLGNLRAGFTRVFYGDFQIEVYKKGLHKVYVRASSLKENRSQWGATLQRGFVFEAFDMATVDKHIDRIIPTDIIRLNLDSQSSGALFAVEYLFDLSHPESAAAYNQFMNYQNWRPIDVARVVTPFTGDNQIVRETLALHIEDVESLSLADANKPEDQARVRRMVKSTTDFTNRSRSGSINFRLIETGAGSNYVEQDIRLTVDPRNNYDQFYRIATTDFDRHWGGWLTFGNEEESRGEANILFQLDANMRIKGFMELNFSYEETDNSFRHGGALRASDISQLAGRIHKILPGIYHGPEFNEEYEPIGPGVRGFVQDLQKFNGDEVYIDVDVVIANDALAIAARLSSSEIIKVVENFWSRILDDQIIKPINHREMGDLKLPDSVPTDSKRCGAYTTKFERKRCYEQVNRQSIENIKTKLIEMLSISNTTQFETQWRILVDLQENELFRNIGSGIFTRLTLAASNKYDKDFHDFLYYRLSIQNTDEEKIVYEKGLKERPKVFSELIKIRNRILNRRFDPSYFQ